MFENHANVRAPGDARGARKQKRQFQQKRRPLLRLTFTVQQVNRARLDVGQRLVDVRGVGVGGATARSFTSPRKRWKRRKSRIGRAAGGRAASLLFIARCGFVVRPIASVPGAKKKIQKKNTITYLKKITNPAACAHC